MRLRGLFRFDLATFMSFVMALNFVIFVNWQLRVTDFYEVRDKDQTAFRAIYIVGIPAPFLKLNGIKQRMFSSSSVEIKPVVQVLSFESAMISIGFNLALTLLLTGAILTVRQEYCERWARSAEGPPPVG